VAADLVFTLPPVTVPPAERIVVSCRPNLATRLLGHRGVDPTGTIQVAHARTIAEALDRLAAALDLPVALVAMEGGRDDAFGAAVAEAMRAPAVSVVPDLDDVREEVASAALVVAGRYHAGICALAAGRPLVLVGSTSKVGNLHRAASSDGVGLIADDATGWAGLVDAARRALDGAPTVPAARDRLVAAAAGAFDVLDAALA
jgi:polysaccharide pyruvyl transferase WcaK-like protein